MPLDQFDTNFGPLSHSEFVVTLGNFADSLLAHPFFRDNWPDYLTHPLKLKEMLAAYNQAANACDTDGGKKNLAEREELRQQAHTAAVLMSQYVVMRTYSEKQPSFLNQVALKVKTRSSKKAFAAKSMTLVAPNVSAKHGASSGGITVVYNKVPGAGTTEVQVCLGDPNDEASWTTAGQYKKCRVELDGFQPGSKISVRARCHGSGDPGPFSQVATIFAL